MKSEEYLYKIISQENKGTAPYKIELCGDWLEIVVGIGKDHTAKILICREDWEMLCDRNG